MPKNILFRILYSRFILTCCLYFTMFLFFSFRIKFIIWLTMISRIDGDVSIGEWHEHFIVQISVINENKQEKKKERNQTQVSYKAVTIID